MDLDELQSVQSRERQTDSLQQLRESFYQEAGDYIQSLREERERAAERADDPWNSPEVGRLSDDIDTAEQTVEAIYERRVGKIVKMASLAAADMPTEDGGLTAEEQRLFDTLVESIERNRDQVMAVLDGETVTPDSMTPSDSGAQSESAGGQAVGDPTADPTAADAAGPREAAGEDAGASPDPPEDLGDPPQGVEADDDAEDSWTPGRDAPTGEESVDAADLMGSGDGGSSEEPEGAAAPTDDSSDGVEREIPPYARGEDAENPPDNTGQSPENGSAGPNGEPAETAGESDGGPESGGAGAGDGARADDAAPDVDRTTVRITDDVGEIFGVEGRSYELSSEDVVTLPEQNAEPLLESGAAERLE